LASRIGGAGYLGHALASYNGFENRGFRIVGVFDNNGDKIGAVGDCRISRRQLLQRLYKFRCQIAVIAVRGAARAVDQLIGGHQSILCYADYPQHAETCAR
jgi:redox-sensing transcriptional repressor